MSEKETAEARRKREEDEIKEWEIANLGVSFTDGFKVRKVVYKINDIDLPFRNGVRLEQFVAFIVGFVLNLILLFVFIYPLIQIFYSEQIALRFHLILLFALPTLLATRIGKPTPTGKTIPGRFMTWLRNLLDDEWHRRGKPIPHAPITDNSIEGNYQRSWYVDPAYAGVEAPNDQPISVFSTYTAQDLPDLLSTRLPAEEKKTKKNRVFETEEEFLGRVQNQTSIGVSEWDDEATEEVLVGKFKK